MNSNISFITNEEDQSLKERSRALIKGTSFFDCLVGYFYSSGFYAVYPALKNTDKIRILIGIGTNRQTFDMLGQANKQPQSVLDFSHAETKQEIEGRVEKIVTAKNENTEASVSALEAEIDRRVYSL